SILLHERGLDTAVCDKIQNYLEENTNLHNVHYEEKKQLDGQFASKTIKMLAEDYATALIGIKSSLINIINVSCEEYDCLVKDMTKEIIELD
ncbi:9083_t:CDS:2, partial [Cetraspora pellucida]